MAEKFGSEFARDMLDRGRRELASALYNEGTVAQPMYPLRGYSLAKQSESPEKDEAKDLVADDRLAGQDREDPGKDDRGMERE